MRRVWIFFRGCSYFWAGQYLKLVSLIITPKSNTLTQLRSHYHKKDRPYLSVFSQLATSLIYDLALNRAVGDPTCFSGFKPWGFNSKAKERTMEDRRTVLACFYIMSQSVYPCPFLALHSRFEKFTDLPFL
jgi:hypothetical protein